MELENLEKNINLENNFNIEKEQRNFLESTVGKIINTAIEVGIRTLLPDFLDEQVINIKDNLFEYGLKEGLNQTINDAIDLGKSAMGIITGKFDNVSQMQTAIETGGIIDGVSGVLDMTINKINKEGIINNNVAYTLKQGKDVILNNVENNIERTFNNQINAIKYTDKYIENWKNYFENKDFEGMQREYKKIKDRMKDLAPIEKVLDNVKVIENLHNLIKNNGQNFNLSVEQLELAKKLI